jgi:type II secretory pathway component PulF
MPLYRYSAIGSDGKAIKGVIDADSLPVAKERLRKQQVLVTTVFAMQSKPSLPLKKNTGAAKPIPYS